MKQIPVQDLMSLRPPTVSSEATVAEATAVLLDHNAAHVYVTDSAGRLQGVIPEYELLKAALCGQLHSAAVSGIMTTAVEAVSPGAIALEVARWFRDGFRSSLPVVDDQGRLVGQLTRREILWLLMAIEQCSGEERGGARRHDRAHTHNSPPPEVLRRRRLLTQPSRRSNVEYF